MSASTPSFGFVTFAIRRRWRNPCLARPSSRTSTCSLTAWRARSSNTVARSYASLVTRCLRSSLLRKRAFGNRHRVLRKTCYTAIEAVREAERRLAETNAARAAHGMEALRYGIGLHIGEVTYGNIGTNERLEFTVIGAAANEAARIEALCDTGYAGPVVRRLRRKFSRSSDFGRAACLTRHRRRTRDLRRGRSGPLP